MPHWKSMMGKVFLGSWDFEQGEEKVVTIKSWRKEKLKENPKNQTSKERDRIILSFVECKELVINNENGERISKILESPDLDDWIGKQIILHVEKVRFGGKMVDGIRVMDKKPEKYSCADCGKEITPAGGWSAKQIADRAKQDFGVCLCVGCAKVRREAAKDAETDA